jgi:hypothetical protein
LELHVLEGVIILVEEEPIDDLLQHLRVEVALLLLAIRTLVDDTGEDEYQLHHHLVLYEGVGGFYDLHYQLHDFLSKGSLTDGQH